MIASCREKRVGSVGCPLPSGCLLLTGGGNSVRTTRTVTNGICGCVCTDGSMLERDLGRRPLFKPDDSARLAPLSCLQQDMSGRVCSTVTLRYNQTEAFGSLQVQIEGGVVQTFL